MSAPLDNPNTLNQKLHAALPQHARRLLLAVSGGVDSMVMLDLCHELAAELKLHLAVAHFNHGLRAESVHELIDVERRCKELALPCFTDTAEPFDGRENVEAWARAVRYQFLEEVRLAENFDYILTAHHADDQAETLLMRLCSGRMASASYTIAQRDERRKLLRPMLSISRAEIDAYARERKLYHVEDVTNLSLARTRNVFRHRIIPTIEQETGAGLKASLAAVSERLNLDESFLWETAHNRFLALKQLYRWAELASLPEALEWRVLRFIARAQVGEEAEKLSYQTLSRVLNEKRAGSLRSRDLGFGIRIQDLSRDTIRFEHRSSEAVVAELAGSLEVDGRSEWVFPDGSRGELRASACDFDERSLAEWLELSKAKEGSAERAGAAYFDAGKLSSKLVFDSRMEGEQMRVLGRGHRKLKKLMQEKSVPQHLREFVPVVRFNGEEILWIPGVGRSDFALLSEATRSVLCLEYRRIAP